MGEENSLPPVRKAPGPASSFRSAHVLSGTPHVPSWTGRRQKLEFQIRSRDQTTERERKRILQKGRSLRRLSPVVEPQDTPPPSCAITSRTRTPLDRNESPPFNGDDRGRRRVLRLFVMRWAETQGVRDCHQTRGPKIAGTQSERPRAGRGPRSPRGEGW